MKQIQSVPPRSREPGRPQPWSDVKWDLQVAFGKLVVDYFFFVPIGYGGSTKTRLRVVGQRVMAGSTESSKKTGSD